MLKNKKVFVLIMLVAVLMLTITSFAADETIMYGPATNDTPYQLADPSTVTPTVYGQKFTFPAGKELVKLTIGSMPTWGPRADGVAEDNSAKLTIYKWNTDYATTKAGTPIKVVNITNHVDGKPVDVVFDQALAQGTYFWEVTEARAGVGGIGFWGGVFSNANVKAYVNGAENDGFYARVILTVREANVNTGDATYFVIFAVVIAMAAVVVKKRAFGF